MSFFTGFGVSAVVYCALNYAWPSKGKSDTFEEVDVSSYESSEKEQDIETNSMDKDVMAADLAVHSRT